MWALDFTPLTTPGRYNIRVAGLGVSHTFLVSADALRPVLGTLARGLYGQRDSVQLSADYLAPWSRQAACFQTDGQPMEVPPAKAFTDRWKLPNTKTTLAVNASTSPWMPNVRRGGGRGGGWKMLSLGWVGYFSVNSGLTAV